MPRMASAGATPSPVSTANAPTALIALWRPGTRRVRWVRRTVGTEVDLDPGGLGDALDADVGVDGLAEG